MASRRGQRYDIPTAVTPNGPTGASSGQSSSRQSGSPLEPSIYEQVTRWTHEVDEKLGELGQPLKPYLPVIGRFLVVSTFFEDIFRILSQFGTQVRYIWQVRGFPWILTVLFLLANVAVMAVGSYFILTKRRLELGVAFLGGVIASQAVVYGLIFDIRFFCRNLSLAGGLLLVVSDVFANDKNRYIPGLLRTDNDSKDNRQRLILGGRSLLVLQFVSHIVRTKWTMFQSLLNLLSILACVLVVIGYKARFSASLLAALLLTQNFSTNTYWRLSANNPNRDFLRYEHFQLLSIVGGLILLVNMGAGRLSFDEKRKIY